MEKVIITVVGKDTVGIIAAVCVSLADHGINILDISQTIVEGFFNMMMVADIAASDIGFNEIQEKLNAVGEKKGVIITCQREEIFESMHRV